MSDFGVFWCIGTDNFFTHKRVEKVCFFDNKHIEIVSQRARSVCVCVCVVVRG